MRRVSLARYCLGVLALMLALATPAWSAPAPPASSLAAAELPVLDENASLEQLSDRLDLIRQGAGVLLEKLWGDQNALRVQKQEHRKAEPRLAKIRLFGGVERHRSEYARWAKAHEALEHQGIDFRRREEELKGFTHTSSLPQYPSDGEKLAAKIAAAAQPDLHQALTMARREAEKAKEAQRAREREQDRQRSKGRDRGGPER